MPAEIITINAFYPCTNTAPVTNSKVGNYKMAIVTKTLDAIYLGEFGDMSLGFPTGNGFREDLAGSYSAGVIVKSGV